MGVLNRAAAPVPSDAPLCPAEPANVVTIPSDEILRMVWFDVSATYRAPFVSAATPCGSLKSARLPSVDPAEPGEPANVVIVSSSGPVARGEDIGRADGAALDGPRGRAISLAPRLDVMGNVSAVEPLRIEKVDPPAGTSTTTLPTTVSRPGRGATPLPGEVQYVVTWASGNRATASDEGAPAELLAETEMTPIVGRTSRATVRSHSRGSRDRGRGTRRRGRPFPRRQLPRRPSGVRRSPPRTCRSERPRRGRGRVGRNVSSCPCSAHGGR